MRVAADKLLDVSIDDGPGDAVLAGAELVYTINFGDPTAGLAEDTLVTILLPLGTTFVAASDGGSIDINGFISWDVGTLLPGDVGTRTLTVDVDGDLVDGAIVRASVQMDDGAGRRTNAQSDTRIDTGVPLTLTLELASGRSRGRRRHRRHARRRQYRPCHAFGRRSGSAATRRGSELRAQLA